MSTLKTYFEEVAKSFQEEKALWTPGWWYLTIEKAVLHLKEESSATDMFHYENLKTLIQKITRLWSNCLANWQITSLESFFLKTGPSLVSTYKTSLSLQIIENVISSINICLSKETLSEEICSDSALIRIMSTLSIPALLVAPNVNAAGGKRSRVDHSDQDTSSDHSSESGDEATTSMLSFISFTKKGETKKRGLKEDVKDLKIIVSI